MSLNPFFQLLALNPTLTPKKNIEGRRYYLRPLPIPDEQHIIQPYQVNEHHLSIFEEYTEGSVNLSPIHYTGEFLIAGQIKKIHVFFDENGKYMDCRLTNETALDILSKADKLKIRIFAENSASEALSALTNMLLKKQKENQAHQDAMLRELEHHKDVKNDIYKAALSATIDKFNTYSKMEFYPDLSIKNILQKRLDYLNAQSVSTKSKTKTKKVISSPNESHSSIPEEKQEKEKNLPEQISKNKKSKKTDLNSSTNDTVLTQLGESLSQRLQRNENTIRQKLERCSSNDFDNLISLTKRLNELGQLRTNVLIQACIDDDFIAINRHIKDVNFNKNEYLAVALLGACVYHNHLALFDHIYNIIDNEYIKHFLYTPPYIQVMPCKYPEFESTSLLGIAYQKRNLPFFKALLTKYHYKPVVDYFNKNTLTMQISQNEADIEYREALANAGADLSPSQQPHYIASSSFDKNTSIPDTKEGNGSLEKTESDSWCIDALSTTDTNQDATTSCTIKFPTDNQFTDQDKGYPDFADFLFTSEDEGEEEEDKEIPEYKGKDGEEVNEKKQKHTTLFDLACRLHVEGRMVSAIEAIEKCILIREGLLTKSNNNPMTSIALSTLLTEARDKLYEIIGLDPDIKTYYYD